MLNDNELHHIANLLDISSDLFSNHGCNDHQLPNTDDNWELYEKMHARNVRMSVEEWRKHKDYEPRPVGDELCFMDWWIMSYLADRVREQLDG